MKNGRQKTIFALSLAAIAIAAILPYVSTWSDPFIADDWGQAVYAKYMTTDELLRDVAFPSEDIYYRAVSITYFRLSFLAWGLNPTGYHVAKGLLYAATAALLYLFVLRATGRKGIALIAGLAFALHPLNASSVIWISTHSNILCAFFYLLALCLFVEARLRSSAGFYAAFLISMLLCFGSYELGYTLPAVVLLTDWLLLLPKSGERRREYLSRGLKWHLPYLAIAGAFFLARFTLMGAGFNKSKPLVEVLKQVVLESAARACLPISPMSIPAPTWMRFLPAALCVLLVAWVIIRSKELRPIAIFASLWFFIGIGPAKNTISSCPEFLNTRFFIIAVPGFAILLGTIFQKIQRGRKSQIAAVLCISALLALYSVRDRELASDWSATAGKNETVAQAALQACRGADMPFRIVFITYPNMRELFNTELKYSISAQIALQPVQEKFRKYIYSPYSGGHNDPRRMDKELQKEYFRFLPIRLDRQGLYKEGKFEENDDICRVGRGDLDKTFFFYWDREGKKLVDCTQQMRHRIAARSTRGRKANLIDWSSPDEMPSQSHPDGPAKSYMKLLNCRHWAAFHTRDDGVSEKVLFIQPLQPGISPILSINPHDTTAMDFDQVEIEFSAVSNEYGQGYFKARVSWVWEDEDDKDPAIIKRAQPLRGVRFEEHSMRRYKIPLAHLFAGEGERKIKSILIIFPPHLKQIKLLRIRLSRFDD